MTTERRKPIDWRKTPLPYKRKGLMEAVNKAFAKMFAERRKRKK